MIRGRRAILTGVLAGALMQWSPGATAQERFALIVSGASGGEPYAERYDTWRSTLVTTLRGRLRMPDDHVVVLAESPGAGVGRASREGVRQSLNTLGPRLSRESVLLIILIGHGTFDGVEAKFNLVGPDLTAREWADLLRPLAGRIVVANTTSTSFPFLERLSAPERIVITATDSLAQRYETVFPQFFVAAFGELAGDLDKDGRVSIWEAFAHASAEVRRWYEQRGRLSTERPLLDDNGDGVGQEAGAPGFDGALARQLFLDPAVEPLVIGNPALAALFERRERLEAAVEDLKARKADLSADVYARELERLLLELARVSRAIRLES